MDGFRSYCSICCNFQLVHRFVTGEYMCGRCIRKIRAGLKKRGIELDRRLPVPIKEIDEIIEQLQKETEGGKKKLERDWRKQRRPAKRIFHRPI